MEIDKSQFYETKMIRQALNIINGDQVEENNERFCVEFGAGDGYDSSNVFGLIKDESFSAVLIEPEKEQYSSLVKRYTKNKNVYCFNEFVQINPDQGLHKILSKTPCTIDFEILSIDIDGNDVYTWLALRDYKPKLVLIEFNPSFPNDIDWRQEADLNIQQGCSLLATTNVAKELGYELIGVTPVNALFVRKEFFERFGLECNDVDYFYDDSIYTTKLGQLYDGELVLLGNKRLMWHRIEIDKEMIQVIPKDLRSYLSSTIVRRVANKRVMSRGDKCVKSNNIKWYNNIPN